MYTRGFITDMIEIEITDDMLSSATRKAEEMGKLNNSILKGKGNIAGFLGEQVALKVLGGVDEPLAFSLCVVSTSNVKTLIGVTLLNHLWEGYSSLP